MTTFIKVELKEIIRQTNIKEDTDREAAHRILQNIILEKKFHLKAKKKQNT